MDSAVTGSPETSVHLFAGDAACSSEMNSEINNLQNDRMLDSVVNEGFENIDASSLFGRIKDKPIPIRLKVRV